MEKLIKALKEKDYHKHIQKTVNIFQFIEDDKPKDWVDDAVEICLNNAFERDSELDELFTQCCFDLGMKVLIKKLAIKPDPTYQLTKADVFAVAMAEIAFDDEESDK